MDFNQQDFERYIKERRKNDPRYTNIPLNSEIENYNNSSSDESDIEESTPNKILDQNIKLNSNPSTIIKKSTLIINSLDRDLDDITQDRNKFKVKFSPSSDSYTKKYPIYANSEFFLQTEYQKKMGIQGFERNIEDIRIKDKLRIDGYSNAYKECSEQPGNMMYDPFKPRGDFLGYNLLYESSDGSKGASIQANFNSIKSIKLKKIIIPNKIRTYPWDITLYGNIFDNIPYIYVKIPELTQNYNSTSSELREAFCVLVQENKQNNININPFSYTTFVPINNNFYVYTPPKNGLNLITIHLIIPPVFHYIPNSIATLSTSSVFTNTSDGGFLNINYQVGVFSEVKFVKQLIIFDYKQQSNIAAWEKRAKLFGVNQPSNFLQERSIYDCPRGPINKNNIKCFAIITNNYFSKETFYPGSTVKLLDYVAKLNKMFANFNTNILKDSDNPLSLEYYIPNLFIKGTQESEIWSDDNIREDGRELLLMSISRILNSIESYLNSQSGIPIIEVGYIKYDEKDIDPANIKNCYEYINNYINIKHLGKDADEIPFCNVKNTNKYSEPFNCDCITSPNEYMSGFCQQATAEHFGDFSNTFCKTKYGFYKGVQKDYRPEGCIISGTKNTTTVNSFYDEEIFPGYEGNISLSQNNGTIDFHYYVEKIPQLQIVNDKCIKNIGLTVKKKIDENKTEKNIKYNQEDLLKYYKTIFINLEKIKINVETNKEYNNKIVSFSLYYKLVKLATDIFFDEINKGNKNTKLIINELEDTLKNFHLNSIKPFFDIEYESLLKELSSNSLEDTNKLIKKFNIIGDFSDIFILWFEIVYSLDIFFDIVNLMNDSNQPIKIKKIYHLFLEKINNDNVIDDNIDCDDVCLEWSLNIIDKEGNKIRPSCFSDPIPFLPSNDSNEKYPDYQNSYCDGKIENNKHNLCKPCCRYIKGSNSDGLCNVIILPFPTILNTMYGLYDNFSDILNLDDEVYKMENLGYDVKNINRFNGIIFSIAFNICKQILYNGGPASFPSEKITAGGETKKCKIISITEQNTFLFEINEVKGNINKII
jgi:hypothetical protein